MARGVTTGFHALGANPMRTTLSTLGVIIGVAALVTILALGDGLEQYSRDQIERTTDLQIIQVVPRTVRRVDGLLIRIDSVRTITSDDRISVSRALGPDYAVARVRTRSALSTAPDSSRPTGVLVLAMDPSAPGMVREALREGAYATDDGVVLSAVAEKLFFPGRKAVGEMLLLDSVAFRVTGVLDGNPSERPIRVLIPLNDRNDSWMQATDRPTNLLVRASRIEDVQTGTRVVEDWVRAQGLDEAVDVQSSRARVQQAGQAMLVFKLTLAAIAAVSLLVGGIGIMNVLLASVSERTREIGVRKSTGATRADIRMQFLAESVAIAGIGSVLGVLLGMAAAVGFAAAIHAITDAPVSAAFTWQSILAAAGSALFIGLVFGTYPARKAARLSPIDAIRHE